MDGAGNQHPTWSPDGTKIAFASTRAGTPQLWVMGANGSGATQLTQGAGFVGSPAWSPDGTRIVFDCQVEAGNDDLCVVNADGTGFARLTNDPGRDYGAAWKPDGSALAFATTRFGSNEIVLMMPTGGSVTRIGTGLAGFFPTWSSDGTQLAFVQLNQYQARIIVVAHADGSNQTTIATGDQPAWRPHH
jgi:TolB protein